MAIVEVDDLKVALGMDLENFAHDDFLERQEEAASAWAAQYTGRAFTETTKTRTYDSFPMMCPFMIDHAWDVKEGSIVIEYFAQGTGPPTEITMFDRVDIAKGYALAYAQNNEWPTEHYASITARWVEHFTPIPQDIQTAVILAVRNILENKASVHDQPTAVTQLLGPYRRI